MASIQIAVIQCDYCRREKFCTTQVECTEVEQGLFFHLALISCHHKDMRIHHYSKLTHQNQELLQARLITNT